ncbi:MAG: carbohydrate-binding protein [Phycisphaeraceae bacterium]
MTHPTLRWTLLLAAVAVAHLALAAGPAVSVARAATYYVDYDAGDDAAAGTSLDAAFRHAPGDPRAQATAADVALAPGDTVIFKGGVVYRGSIEVHDSGRPDAPITYDGNSDNTFGDGRAILDGGELVTDWQRCASADDCGGNSNWRHIYKARVPAHPGLDAQSVGLVQGDRLLFVAQYPNPDEPFYDGNQSRYLDAPQAPSRTELTDPRLAELGAAGLAHAWAYLRTTSNFVDYQPITAWDPDTHTLTYEQTNRDTTGRYAIANSLHEQVFDGPGQYVFVPGADDGDPTVYVWPWDDADPAELDMTYNVRGTAIDFGRREIAHVRVQGFEIRHYRTAITGRDTTGITIHDNEITRIRSTRDSRAIAFTNVRDHVVSDNHIHHAQRTNAVQTHTGENVVYAGNRIEMVARSPMRFYRVERGQMIDNVITDCRGVHSNALTIYVDSRDILVARNIVHRSNIALTLQNAGRIYVINNVLTANGSAVGLWPGNMSRDYFFLNNHIGGTVFVNDPNARSFVFRNNIIGRLDGYPLDDSHVLAHNIYLSPLRGLREGEFILDSAADAVGDRDADGVRPRPAGPTIDMGADVAGLYPRETFPDFEFDRDLAGQPRVHGSAIDIGPYERAYEPGELADRRLIATGADAEPPDPIDAYRRIDDAEAITLRAIDFTDQSGGAVGFMDPDTQAHRNFVRGWNAEGHWLEYAINVPAAGDYRLSLRYAADIDAPRSIAVNGQTVVEQLDLSSTGGWSDFDTLTIDTPIHLDAGENVIRLTSRGGNGCNLDELRFTRDGQDDITVTAGGFTDQGGHDDNPVDVVAAPHHGLFLGWNDDGHWLEWTIDDAEPGMYEVVLRYATLSTSPREVSVNGQTVEHLEQVTLDRTAGWRVTREASLPAPIELRGGENVLRLTSRGGFGLNLDEIMLIPVE